MRDDLARRLWTDLQECLPTHYRRIAWSDLQPATRERMTRVALDALRGLSESKAAPGGSSGLVEGGSPHGGGCDAGGR